MPPDPLVIRQNADAPALSAISDAPVVTPPAPEPQPTPELQPAAADTPTPDAPPGDDDSAAPAEDEASAQPGATEGTAKPPRPQDARLWRERRLADERMRAADERYDRLAALTERLIAAQKPADQVPAPHAAPLVTPEPHPTRDDFDTPQEYDAAWLQWTAREGDRIAAAAVERKLAEQREIDNQAAAEQRRREQFDRSRELWQERKAKAIERMPDYLEVAERDDMTVSASMALIIQDLETGPEIAYHLGKHPEEAARIAAMVLPGQYFPPGHAAAGEPVPDVGRQIYELGRIAAVATAPRPEITRAPTPITPLGSNGSARQKPLAEMTTEEYAAYRMPIVQAARRPGMIGIPEGQLRPARGS